MVGGLNMICCHVGAIYMTNSLNGDVRVLFFDELFSYCEYFYGIQKCVPGVLISRNRCYFRIMTVQFQWPVSV